jgi:hypothetical protein
MRYGQIPPHRARARKQFRTLSDTLTALKESFRSAAYIGDMGNKLLAEMERVRSNVSGTRTPLNANLSNDASRSVPTVTVPQQSSKSIKHSKTSY